jgi:hypothetical protein
LNFNVTKIKINCNWDYKARRGFKEKDGTYKLSNVGQLHGLYYGWALLFPSLTTPSSILETVEVYWNLCCFEFGSLAG